MVQKVEPEVPQPVLDVVDVYLDARKVGALRRENAPGNPVTFAYDESVLDDASAAVSVHLPVRAAPYPEHEALVFREPPAGRRPPRCTGEGRAPSSGRRRGPARRVWRRVRRSAVALARRHGAECGAELSTLRSRGRARRVRAARAGAARRRR